MKKIFLIALCTLALCTSVMAQKAQDNAVNFSVKEEDRAAMQAKIDKYQKESDMIVKRAQARADKAEADLKREKALVEKIIADAEAVIVVKKKEAEQASQRFTRAQEQANEEIAKSNEEIKKANEDLKIKLNALKQ